GDIGSIECAKLPRPPTLVISIVDLPADAAIPGPVGIEQLAFGILRAGEELLDRRDLRCGQTCVPLGTFTRDRRELGRYDCRRAGREVVDDPVGESVERIARAQDR